MTFTHYTMIQNGSANQIKRQTSAILKIQPPSYLMLRVSTNMTKYLRRTSKKRTNLQLQQFND